MGKARASQSATRIEPPLRTDLVAARALLLRAVKAPVELQRAIEAGSAAIVIEVPDSSFVHPVGDALRWFVAPTTETTDGDSLRSFDRWPSVIFFERDGSHRTHRPNVGSDTVASALARGRAVIGIAPDPDLYLPRGLVRAADHRTVIPSIDADVVAEVIEKMTGRRPARRPPDELARDLSLQELCIAVRPGSTIRQCMARLRRISASKTPDLAARGPRLADLHGLDEACDWGETLARDLSAYRRRTLRWSEVDRGLLLAGPTGTGKTTYARALATSCGCPLICGSLGEWQAAGHLGDLLKAMRRTFDEARQRAPCILFIDEIDSFGDRNSFSHDNRDYSVQVVNAFLELLDGIQSREGVVVVGATNNPDRIDPAIKRSGRLDRIITVDWPDVEALQGIFRHHLGDDLAEEDLSRVALAAVGGTGADVERWVRAARRTARIAERPLAVEDIMAELRSGVASLSPDELLRAAVHEAGHAVAASLLKTGDVLRVSIEGSGPNGGTTLVRSARTTMVTPSECRALLTFSLAGRAAEEVVLGQPSSGAGGHSDSDLAHATELAFSMETAMGLPQGSDLLWLRPQQPQEMTEVLVRNTALATRVSNLIEKVYAEAVALLRAHLPLLQAITEALVRTGELDGAELEALIASSSAIDRPRAQARSQTEAGDRG